MARFLVSVTKSLQKP